MERRFSFSQQRRQAFENFRGSNQFWLLPLLVLTPTALMLGLDFSLRGERFYRFSSLEWQSYLLSVFQAALLWGGLVLSFPEEKRLYRGFNIGAFLLFFSLAMGGQAYFFQQYNAYMNIDVSKFAIDFSESILHQLWADRVNLLSFKLPALLLSIVVVVLARLFIRPSKKVGHLASRLAPALLGMSFFVPVEHRHRQASTPDLLYMNSIGGVVLTELGLTKESHQKRPRSRKSATVPLLSPQPSRARNVVFVILESVRKDATCTEFDPQCKRTEATNLLFPDRYSLEQMRALDSSTAISMAVLWSGLPPTETRHNLHTWPLVFDYARQAGYHTAYWTSQSVFFGNMRLWLKNLNVDSFFSATDIDPESDIDLGAPEDAFADRAIRQLPSLKEPFFLTIQLSNGHYPYLVQDRYPQPFQPASTSKAPENNLEFFNHYQNAVYQQDMHLARVLSALAESDMGSRTVIVTTSDHGEAFREHGQMGHTFSLMDEEVLVPTWVQAPLGTLSKEESQNLRNKKNSYTFHPDLTATVLDLLGVWDAPSVVPFRKRIVGSSLLRKEENLRALPMTNCSSLWSCAFENWGYMQGAMKLEARAWDVKYHCWDLRRDPEESSDLGEDACGGLKSAAWDTFGKFPGKDGP